MNRPVPAAELEQAALSLSPRELTTLFAPVSRARCIALAVSGGADSLALMEGIRQWAAPRRVPPQVHVFIVDHRLRPESAREAAAVRRAAHRMGFAARVLVRKGDMPTGDVEAAARAARYRLLIGAARAAGASHLLVAHHREDVAETFLMRARRGAGIFGLAAMRPLIDLALYPGALPDLRIFRPFLHVPRARLAALVAAAGLTPVIDPMNDDPRFERTRFRRMIAAGLVDSAAVAALAFRFAGLAGRIDDLASRFMREAVTVDEFAVVRMDRQAFATESEEVRLRVLVRILQAIGGDDHPPRFTRLAAVHAAMLDAASFRRTLAGCVIDGAGRDIAFYREVGRGGLPEKRLRPGESFVWDGRFLVNCGTDLSPGMTIGAGGRTSSDWQEGTRVPVSRAVTASLPVVWRRAKVVGLPAFQKGGQVRGVRICCLVKAALAAPRLFPA